MSDDEKENILHMWALILRSLDVSRRVHLAELLSQGVKHYHAMTETSAEIVRWTFDLDNDRSLKRDAAIMGDHYADPDILIELLGASRSDDFSFDEISRRLFNITGDG